MKIKIMITFLISFGLIIYFSIINNPSIIEYKAVVSKYNSYVEQQYDDLDFSDIHLDGFFNGTSYDIKEVKINFDQYNQYTCVVYEVNYEIKNYDFYSDRQDIRAYGYELKIPIDDNYFISYKNSNYHTKQLLFLDQTSIQQGENSNYFFWCKKDFSDNEREQLQDGSYTYRIGDGSDKETFCGYRTWETYQYNCPAMYKEEVLKAEFDDTIKISEIPYIKEWLDDYFT